MQLSRLWLLIPLLIVGCFVLPSPAAAQQRSHPLIQNFDSSLLPASPSPICGVGFTGSLPRGWANDPSLLNEWRLGTDASTWFSAGLGPIPSGTTVTTGPTADATSGQGNYLYVESSCSCTGSCRDAIITGPQIAPAGLGGALEFKFHLKGTGAGVLNVEVRNSGLPQWRTVWSRGGNHGDAWQTARAPLFARGVSTAVDWVQFRFVYVSALTNDGDCALDDVALLPPGTSVPAPQHAYQVNSSAASCSVDGILADFETPAIVRKCFSEPLQLDLASPNVGMPWDLVVAPGPAVSAASGAAVTPNGQVLNLDQPSAASIASLVGLTPTWTGPVTMALTTPSVLGTTCVAFGIADPTTPDGFALSQTTQIDIGSGAALPVGPQGDDEIVTINLGPGGYCGTSGTISAFPVFGTPVNTIGVSSNGRIFFEPNVSPDWSPTLQDAMTGPAFVGFWTDFDPSWNAWSGFINITEPTPGVIEISYAQLSYHSSLQPQSDFQISLDTLTGTITLSGLGGIAVNASIGDRIAGTAQFLGMTPGYWSFDPTALPPVPPTTSFAPGTSGTFSPVSMVYDWYDGLPPSLGGSFPLVPSLQGAGVQTIVFTPAMTPGGAGYSWSAF